MILLTLLFLFSCGEDKKEYTCSSTNINGTCETGKFCSELGQCVIACTPDTLNGLCLNNKVCNKIGQCVETKTCNGCKNWETCDIFTGNCTLQEGRCNVPGDCENSDYTCDNGNRCKVISDCNPYCGTNATCNIRTC